MRRPKNTAAINAVSITAAQARARVNRFLLSQVGSQFCAGEPELDVIASLWRVPILMITPGFIAGQVGEATVNAQTREIQSHTEIERIYVTSEKLRKRHHAEIKAAFLRARKG